MVNLLEKLNYTRTALIQGKEAEGREEGKETSANSLRFVFCVRPTTSVCAVSLPII